MGRTLSRVAGIVSAGALVTFAAAPAALAQETDTTAPVTTTTTSSESTTTSTTTTSESTTPVTTTQTTAPSTTTEVTTTTPPEKTTTSTTSATTTPPDDDFPDNTGHGFVGVGGEGVLVINCAAGHVGNVATQYLSVTGGPDQDESDGRIWNFTVRVENLPAGTTTGKFSWTCDGVEGEGIVEFEQEQPPASSSTVPSSTAPVVTATSSSPATTTTPAGNAAPKAQVKVAPKGGVETGFGGTASW